MLDLDDLILLDDTVAVATRRLGLPVYDFDFRSLLACRTARAGAAVVARIGAIVDYPQWCAALASRDLLPIQTEDAHRRCTRLDCWYPLLSDLTPRSVVYEQPPTAARVAGDFAFPVFVKGVVQTSRHARSSIAANAEQFDALMAQWHDDPILRWQRVAVREFVPLQRVAGGRPQDLPPSCEFRVFYWRGQRAGHGRYWHEVPDYSASAPDLEAGLALADEAARRLAVPFLVIDVARTATGRWLVIEANDAQESGYAAVSPLALWQRIVHLERAHLT